MLQQFCHVWEHYDNSNHNSKIVPLDFEKESELGIQAAVVKIGRSSARISKSQ